MRRTYCLADSLLQTSSHHRRLVSTLPFILSRHNFPHQAALHPSLPSHRDALSFTGVPLLRAQRTIARCARPLSEVMPHAPGTVPPPVYITINAIRYRATLLYPIVGPNSYPHSLIVPSLPLLVISPYLFRNLPTCHQLNYLWTPGFAFSPRLPYFLPLRLDAL